MNTRMSVSVLFSVVTFIFGTHPASAVEPENSPYWSNKKVRALYYAGTPQLSTQSSTCPAHYGNQQLGTVLGSGTNYHCVQVRALPSDVLTEIKTMSQNQLEAPSDYDIYVTKLYVFKQDSFSLGTGFTPESIQALAQALGIPKKQINNLVISAFSGTNDDLSEFDNLTTGSDADEPSLTYRYLQSLLAGKHALIATFGDGVELLPGGGLSVHYSLILTSDGTLVYIKSPRWDA